jgi:hypothetical protein
VDAAQGLLVFLGGGVGHYPGYAIP